MHNFHFNNMEKYCNIVRVVGYVHYISEGTYKADGKIAINSGFGENLYYIRRKETKNNLDRM